MQNQTTEQLEALGLVSKELAGKTEQWLRSIPSGLDIDKGVGINVRLHLLPIPLLTIALGASERGTTIDDIASGIIHAHWEEYKFFHFQSEEEYMDAVRIISEKGGAK